MICAALLVLAMDVSGSVSDVNFALQRDATAAAISDPGLVRLIDPEMPIAVGATMWGTESHRVTGWHVIRTQDDADTFAARLRGVVRPGQGGTHMSAAVQDAMAWLDEAPCTADRSIVDVSGDGANAGWPPMEEVRDEAAQRGVQINGLPIVTPAEPDVEASYRAEVVTPGGVVIVAQDWADFARAIRRKISYEISAAMP